MRAVLALLFVVGCALVGCALVGCNATPCELPDQACPVDAPAEGNACLGELACLYVHPDFPSDPMGSRFTCVEGAWREEVLCDGCGPRRSESCRTPDTTSAPGEVRLTLSDPPIVFGSQGLAMVAYTVAIDDGRGCVELRETTTIDGMTAPGEHTAALHCGASRTIYAILYDLPCTAPSHAIGLEVEVVGVGRASTSFEWHGEGCPLGP
jgi:hypothetical protein